MAKESTETKKEEKGLVVTEDKIKDMSIFAVEEGEEEHLSQDELELPFLKLAQKSSPQVDEDKPEHIEGLKPGQFFNSVSGNVYGDSINVQVHGYFHNYVIWKGLKGNGKYQGAMSTDAFREFEKKNKLEREGGDLTQTVDGEMLRYTDTHNFIVTLPEHEEDGIMIYSLSSTGCKVARKMNTLNNGRRVNGRPAKRYATIWELVTDGFLNDDGFAYKQVAKLKPLGWATAELMAFGKSFEDFVKAIKETGVKYSDDSSANEAAESSEY